MIPVVWIGLVAQVAAGNRAQEHRPQAQATQVPAGSQAPVPKADPPEELPPEEDVAAKPKEYSFNPLQAQNELRIGNYYMKKGKYRAAAQRFQEASLWNNGLAEAYERWGAAEEKAHEGKKAREAYEKYLQIAPDAKDAGEIRKRIKKL